MIFRDFDLKKTETILTPYSLGRQLDTVKKTILGPKLYDHRKALAKTV